MDRKEIEAMIWALTIAEERAFDIASTMHATSAQQATWERYQTVGKLRLQYIARLTEIRGC